MVATTESENSEIVTNWVGPPSEIVAVELSPTVVDKSVTMLEMEPGVTTVGGLELEVVVVDAPVAMLGDGLGLKVTGGTFGNVMFQAGHPEDAASRRTGQ